MKSPFLIVALDVKDAKSAKAWVKRLSPQVSFYKVGLRLFIKEGPALVKWIKAQGCKVFLDLKLHDIPNTVAQAVESALQMNVDMISVHALGGSEMLKAAVKAAKNKTKIFAVTILTSTSEIKSVGISDSISNQVKRLAKLSAASGVHGIICSPQEISTVKKIINKNQKILTPGIRPTGAALHDQKRVATPQQAIKDGANYLVMGRPILEANDAKSVVTGLLALK